REGLSLSLLEAMRGGRASVVTRVGGNAEAVEDGVTGLVVPAGDAEALARAMGELLGDGARRERMGVEARARWARAFTAERMVRDTEALYHAALGRPAPAAAPAEADACA
ncbi:MAG: glycosyltransferase, partial [Candidatus Eisenbacteria bacterium]|nr:glycosyltransferase [Candidatus Eisenbacteria bacterium]